MLNLYLKRPEIPVEAVVILFIKGGMLDKLDLGAIFSRYVQVLALEPIYLLCPFCIPNVVPLCCLSCFLREKQILALLILSIISSFYV